MNDVDQWIYFDGPEPDRVRPFLDALRDLPPATPADKERIADAFFKRLDAKLGLQEEPADAPEPTWEREGTREWPGPDRRSTLRDPEEAEGDENGSGNGSGSEGADLCSTPMPSRPPVVPAPAELACTGPLDLSAVLRAALPFEPPSPERPRAPKTLQGAVMRARFGETAPLGDDSIQKAIAALPFAGNTVGAGIVPFPRLTLEQYASLRAELAVRPEVAAETLLRYRVLSEAGRRALDEHWQKLFAEDPETGAVFEKKLAEFTGWLRVVPR